MKISICFVQMSDNSGGDPDFATSSHSSDLPGPDRQQNALTLETNFMTSLRFSWTKFDTLPGDDDCHGSAIHPIRFGGGDSGCWFGNESR